MKAIPEDIALEFSRKRDNNCEWNASELIQFLRKEIEGRERAQTLTRGTQDSGKNNKNNEHTTGGHSSNKNSSNKRTEIGSASALSINANNNNNNKCIYCSKENAHALEDCTESSLDERRAKVKALGLCFVCLRARHTARYCKGRRRGCKECGRWHHVSLCEGRGTPGKETAVASSIVPAENLNEEQQKTVLLQTGRAVAKGNSASLSVRFMLDSGSQRTFVEEAMSRALGLVSMGEENLKIHTFGSEVAKEQKFKRVRLTLTNNLEPDKSIEIEALESPTICGASVNIPRKDLTTKLSSKGINLADFSTGKADDQKISLLIGADWYWKVVTGRVERLDECLVALETMLGWCIQGPTTAAAFTGVSIQTVPVMKVAVETGSEISDILRKFWDIDSLGISERCEEIPNNDMVLKHFESTVTMKNGRYEVKLPWRSDVENLPDNLHIAETRMESLIKRFRRNLALYSRYRDVIEEQQSEGIVEEVVAKNDSLSVRSRVYYMPHHAVMREEKTTKTRVVYDASSHERGCPSLNNCLLPGPNLNPDLLQLLLRFRTHKIAITADIQKAFLQIGLAEEDRDAVRFLWIDQQLTEKPPEIKTMRMTRVCFGVTSSPFLLAATIKHHLKKFSLEYPITCTKLENDLYVDDFISGVDDEESAPTVVEEATNILAAAKMNLRGWKTNSEHLRKVWETKLAGTNNGSKDESECTLKVLGMGWNPKSDTFVFEISNLLQFITNRKDTKRFVLQAAARIFDPLGFITPYVIRVKCIFQRMWEDGIKWDADLPDKLKLLWQQWCLELPLLQQLSVPRCYYVDEIAAPIKDCIELHGFCDSSQTAYGAVVYLRYRLKNGEARVAFVTSRSRVAPLKRLTLPRLELLGAFILTRLMKGLLEVFQVNTSQVFYWCDSKIVLHWIRGSLKKLKQFVGNRVAEIQAATDSEGWRHCPGDVNPADKITRGMHAGKLRDDANWWHGPDWLKLEKQYWPNNQIIECSDETELAEAQKEIKKETEDEAVLQVQCDYSILPLDPNDYSAFKRLVRVTAWVFRIINNLKGKVKRRGTLASEELESAETFWICQSQRKNFFCEINMLKTKGKIEGISRIAQVNPFIDEHGLIRVGGRMQHADLGYGEMHPLILHPNDKVTKLLIKECHERVLHSGVCDTLTQVRERFWVLKGRQAVKSVIKACLHCRRFNTKPATQVVAPLPRDRLTEAPPFDVTGIDFAGPIFVKEAKTSRKAYIALFTCAVSRAIHLELVSDLTTESFMMALRRFISRRGIISTVYCDNALTFKKANRELKEAWKAINSADAKDFFGNRGIKFKFIVERAPWWGGFYERMVRLVKVLLRKTLGRALLRYEELETVLTEVEATINSRPITYVHNDQDEPLPLTPAHLLIGQRLTSLPERKLTSENMNATREQITKRIKYRESLIAFFWKRWRSEYLADLRQAHRNEPQRGTDNLKIDDIVLIGEDKVKRNFWKIGRITEVFYGRDNKVRACLVKLPTQTVVRRPVQLLYPLEIN